MTNTGSWPAEHRAALLIVVHVDAPGPEEAPFPVGAGIDYTPDGLARLLAQFEDLDVAVTTAWNSAALSTYPQLARNAQDRGHELALSTIGHGASPGNPSDLAGRISDLPILGQLTALPYHGAATDHAGSQSGDLDAARWMVDGSGGDRPRLQQAASSDAGTVILPVSPYWVDSPWWRPDSPSPPSLLLESWSAGLASIRTFGGLMTVVLHPHLSGRPGHAETIVRFVDEAIASADVWIARADQIATWWISRSEARSS